MNVIAFRPRQPLHEFYVLVQPWGVYVKDAATFRQQGGCTEVWGRRWRLVQAADADEAQEKAKTLAYAAQ